jgi:hypothetical protein
MGAGNINNLNFKIRGNKMNKKAGLTIDQWILLLLVLAILVFIMLFILDAAGVVEIFEFPKLFGSKPPGLP